MTAAVTVHCLDAAASGEWQFRDSTLRWRSPYGGVFATFDPFPAYPHDAAAVQATVDHVQAQCPPRWPVHLYVADREEIGRSNGYSDIDEGGHYQGDQWVQDPPTGLIVLSGKRIPPHPVMTWYLVAHEYGHHIEWMLSKTRGAAHAQDQALIRKYAAMRGLPVESVHHGSGGRWHDSAAEIFACDFRIRACGVECGYWPHPGIPHPDTVPGLGTWWQDALAELAT